MPERRVVPSLPAAPPSPWVPPWWLQRQLDARSPAWLPADLAGTNRTGRSWTVIGLPDSPPRWLVDPRGLLVGPAAAWALDWWVGAEDRWHLPSTDAGVRQRLVDDAPVVETAMRVPGGDVVVRHWAVPGADGVATVLMEIDNASAAPVAVAVSLRPWGLEGPVTARAVAIEGGRLLVDGAVVVRAEVAPRQVAAFGGSEGDVGRLVLANRTPAAAPASADGPAGTVTAAMVWPLAHRAALRLELPGPGGERHARRDRPGRPARAAGGPGGVPGPADTARGWSARVGRTTRFDLPPGPLASALRAQPPQLLLAAASPAAERRCLAGVVAALVGVGLREEAAVVLDGWLDDQQRNGALGDGDQDTAATLWALAAWAATGADDGLVARSPLAVGRAVERLARRAPADPVALVWTAAGLRAGTVLLGRLGEEEAAARAGGWAAARSRSVAAVLAGSPAARPASDGPAGPDAAVGPDAGTTAAGPDAAAGLDAVTAAALVAVALGVVGPADPLAAAARREARARSEGLPAGAVAGPAPLLGASPEATARWADAAVRAGSYPDAELRWLLSVAGPTWTWPTVVDPRLGGGSHGSGCDPAVSAALWTVGRSLLVDDARPAAPAGAAATRLRLLGALPPDWLGQGVEVHGAPTTAGALSYALRWHGERPALLWELAGPGPDVAVTSGLDPSWSATGRRGEALLGPVAPPSGAPDATGGPSGGR